jgi:predicted amidohydrolase YtcJ
MPVTGLVPQADSDQPADLVIRSGRVFTGDPRRPAASAVAVRGGRILNVSDDHGVARHVVASTRVVDAMGRRVIPGLVDSHMHVIRTGLHYLLELRWDGIRWLSQALAMLAEQAARTPEGQWVRVVGGWSKDQFAEQRLPTIGELNAAAPDTPVMPGEAVYCAAKAGIEMLTRVLAAEQQAAGFRAIAVRPGVMYTDLQAHARAQPPDVLPGAELLRELHRQERLVAPAAVASKIVTRLVVGYVEHGRTYSYREL